MAALDAAEAEKKRIAEEKLRQPDSGEGRQGSRKRLADEGGQGAGRDRRRAAAATPAPADAAAAPTRPAAAAEAARRHGDGSTGMLGSDAQAHRQDLRQLRLLLGPPPAVYDLKGLNCPLPVLKARKRLARMRAGSRLWLETTDPLAVIDIPAFCTEVGHRLVESGGDRGRPSLPGRAGRAPRCTQHSRKVRSGFERHAQNSRWRHCGLEQLWPDVSRPGDRQRIVRERGAVGRVDRRLAEMAANSRRT